MNRHLNSVVRRAAFFCWICILPAGASALPSGWQHEQPFTVPAAGIVKLNLPVETLDAARPGLEDLRLYDAAGNEVPYWIAHPVPVVRKPQSPKSFQVSLTPQNTIVALETGLTQAVDGVTLESAANNFIKAVRIEGSRDGETWQTLGEGQPIFRQPNGAAQLHLSFSSAVWPRLRLIIDDRRSQPIPLTGAAVYPAEAGSEPENAEWMQPVILDRHENPRETRLTLDLGAANLDLTAIQIQSDAPLFTRNIALAVTRVSEDSAREDTLARGTIFRVALEGGPVSENLIVPLHNQVGSRQLILLVENGDSPPLPIQSVRVKRRQVPLLFLARQTGSFAVLTGNSRCSAPSYDVGALNVNPGTTPLLSLILPPLAASPDYVAPEVLPGVAENGAPLDVSAWAFRKPVKIDHGGAQQLELDLDALAHSQPGLQDLRLLHDDRQIPFIVEHTSITRSIPVSATAAKDAKDPGITRWTIQLPEPGLPMTQLSCTTLTPLFQREMTLYEEMEDRNGAKYRQPISQATWMQMPDQTNREFVLQLAGPVRSGQIFLETRNGDNPPIDLHNFRVFYPVSRILFKATTNEPDFLYYGNAKVAQPQYDLSLVGNQLVKAAKSTATLSAEERLKGCALSDSRQSGAGSVALWSTLALVVVVLLWLIARLLPKSPPP